MRFSTIFTALFCPYVTYERTPQNLDFVSLLFALFLIERHRSKNQGSLQSEERLSNFKERCAQLCKITYSTTMLTGIGNCAWSNF